MSKQKVLVIDDDYAMLDLAQYHLQKYGYEVATAQSAEDGLQLMREHSYPVALVDLYLPDSNGITLVEKLLEIAPTTAIIMVTGNGSISTAVEAMNAGASSFVEKPVNFEQLLALITKEFEHWAQAEELRELRKRLTDTKSYHNIIGGSKAMRTVYEIIESVAESDANVMIVGESGTGKELIANAIHHKSLRKRQPFVKINCSALPKELIESELFGHTKGAFYGRDQ